jgi:hypothetical protein
VASKARPLTRTQRIALEKFARLEITLEDLANALREILQFDFKESERRLSSHFLIPQPGVRIDQEHIRRAMDKHAHEEISTNQLSDWATMLLLNDAYDWEGPDEEEIAAWLNDISALTLKRKARAAKA